MPSALRESARLFRIAHPCAMVQHNSAGEQSSTGLKGRYGRTRSVWAGCYTLYDDALTGLFDGPDTSSTFLPILTSECRDGYPP
jgi:hypothetical protein